MTLAPVHHLPARSIGRVLSTAATTNTSPPAALATEYAEPRLANWSAQ